MFSLLSTIPVSMRWAICTLYAGAGVAAALLPQATYREMTPTHWDKLDHFLVYGFLALLMCWALKLGLKSWKQLFWAAPIALTYGVGVEMIQLLKADRCFSWLDMAANCLGMFFFVLLYAFFSWTYKVCFAKQSPKQTHTDQGTWQVSPPR
jgi:VanZ family protein